MKRRTLIILVLLGATLGVGWYFWFGPGERGPLYEGKYAQEWLGAIAGDSDQVAEAKKAFREMGSEALPYLLGVLTNKPSWRDSYVRLKSRLPKPVLGATPAAPGIDWQPRESAATALGEIGVAAAAGIPALIEALNDSESDVVSSGPASGGLSQQWSPAARIAAMEALWKIAPDSPEVVSAATAALQQKYFPDSRIADAAAQGLADLGPELKDAIPAVVQNLKYCDQKVWRPLPPNIYPMGGLAPGYAESVSKLIPVLQDSNPRAREAAAYDLGALRRGERSAARIAIPTLIAAGADGDDVVRITAMEAIAKIDAAQGTNAIPVLVELLQGNDYRVRLRSVDVLKSLGAAARLTLPALTTSATNDPARIVRVWAAEAIEVISQAPTNGIPVP